MKTKEAYCVNCKKNTANKISSVRKTKQDSLMIITKTLVLGELNQTY